MRTASGRDLVLRRAPWASMTPPNVIRAVQTPMCPRPTGLWERSHTPVETTLHGRGADPLHPRRSDLRAGALGPRVPAMTCVTMDAGPASTPTAAEVRRRPPGMKVSFHRPHTRGELRESLLL
ncbi:hypothetical protein GCM10010151_18310 [Actinoallomurus spadix]|uniref:Uncharacterized protein n=1 Tax=Actinoallomurus spadix TaxID=79912 RepID=A0ABP3FX52_9ACTN